KVGYRQPCVPAVDGVLDGGDAVVVLFPDALEAEMDIGPPGEIEVRREEIKDLRTGEVLIAGIAEEKATSGHGLVVNLAVHDIEQIDEKDAAILGDQIRGVAVGGQLALEAFSVDRGPSGVGG